MVWNKLSTRLLVFYTVTVYLSHSSGPSSVLDAMANAYGGSYSSQHGFYMVLFDQVTVFKIIINDRLSFIYFVFKGGLCHDFFHANYQFYNWGESLYSYSWTICCIYLHTFLRLLIIDPWLLRLTVHGLYCIFVCNYFRSIRNVEPEW